MRKLYLVLLFLTFGLIQNLAAVPTVDGLFYAPDDNGISDSSRYVLYNTSIGGSKLWYTVSGSRLYVALVVDRAVNDNVFSPQRNSAYTVSAGFPNHRSAKKLTDSEFAQFTLTIGGSTIQWQQGYADQQSGTSSTDPSWYSSHEAGAGLGTPPPDYVSSSSIVWNFNNYANNPNTNWDLYQNSANLKDWKAPFDPENPNNVPGLDGYPVTGDLGFSTIYQWEWSMVYEWSCDLSSYGSNPILVISGASHHSPPKSGPENDVFPDPPGNGYLSDYGDLPDTYNTLLASDGAFHYIVPNGLFLGTSVDPEPDGLPGSLALGDDDSASDDEDGIIFTDSWVQGSTPTIEVTASGTGNLSAWADFNNDGDFNDAGEYIFADQVLTEGIHNLQVSVPANAMTGQVYTRFRYSTDVNLSSSGLANDGEVEDYQIEVQQPASIGDLVWLDTNGNGIQDGGESGLSNVVVNLYRPGFGPDGIAGNGDESDVASSTTTATDGTYAFDNLYPGSYYVEIVKPAGLNFTTPNQGSNDLLDSDVNLSSGLTSTTVLSPGENDISWDAGLYQPASLGDYVWMDNNGNGVQDPDESGIGGVRIFVDSNANGSYDNGEPFNVTSADGSYLITDLIPGTHTVRVDTSTLPNGLMQTYDLNGALDHSADATLISGQNRLDVDFGYRSIASIGDLVWLDNNGNGVQDGGEPGLSNVVINLYRPGFGPDGVAGNGDDGDVVLSTTTATDGTYAFVNLYPGSYYVKIVKPAGFNFTTPNQGSNDLIDSDVNISSGLTSTTVLSPGENDISWDAGLYQPASLGDYVWMDNNGDRVQDPDESGIGGVRIFVDSNANGSYDNGEPFNVTSADGSYLITDLIPGTHIVRVDTSTLPNGLIQTYDLNGTLDHSAEAALISGQNRLDVDFGYRGKASLGNYVWNDGNQDGLQDADEPGVQDIIVNLYDDSNTIIRTTTTNSSGYYNFVNLDPDNYYVGFENGTWQFTENDYNDNNYDETDSDANPANGQTEPFFLAAGEDNLTIDCGLYSSDPLPVTLSTFNAVFANGKSRIQWTTQSESNNAFWNIYRAVSQNVGQSVKVNYESIAGAGSTSEPTNYNFHDNNLGEVIQTENLVNPTIYYWIESVDNSGNAELHGPVSITVINSEEGQSTPEIPDVYGLNQNYPNPFNPDTGISFNLAKDGKASLHIYNVKGERVKTLFQGREYSKNVTYTEHWNGKDSRGNTVSSGIYLAVLKTDKELLTRKMILQK